MTVLCIDTRTRELKAFTASLTQAASGLVLRVAAQLGGLSDLLPPVGTGVLRPQYPVIVLTGGYSAQSSAGFASVLGTERFSRTKVVGGSGFGYEKYFDTGTRRVGDGLRRFKAPLEAVLLPADCAVELLPTHGNSNPATADAAVEGLRLLAARPGSIVIAEGQSDWTRGYLIRVPRRTDRGCYGQYDWLAGGMEIPSEHRTDVFSEEAVAVNGGLRAIIGRLVASTDDQRAVWTAARLLATTLIRAGTTPSELVEAEAEIGRDRLIDVLAGFPSASADLSVELSREGLGRDALLVLKASWGNGGQTQAEVVRLELGRDAADALAEALSAMAEEAGPAELSVTVGRRRGGRRRNLASSVEEAPSSEEELGEA